MPIDCVVTGPPAVGITSPLGAGGTTTVNGVAYSSEQLCRVNDTTVVVFWENTGAGATAAGWIESSTGVYSAGSHPTGLVACSSAGGRAVKLVNAGACVVNDSTGAVVGRIFVEPEYDESTVPFTYVGFRLAILLPNGTFTRPYALPGGHSITNCSINASNDFHRVVWDCNAGVATQFARWYSGVTHLPTVDLTLNGATYVPTGTVIYDCPDNYTQYKEMKDCTTTSCIPVREKKVYNCSGVTTTIVDENEAVYTPTGTLSYGLCYDTQEPYHDISAGKCIPVYRHTNACNQVTYRRLDHSVWTPTVSLAEGVCPEFEYISGCEVTAASNNTTSLIMAVGTAVNVTINNAVSGDSVLYQFVDFGDGFISAPSANGVVISHGFGNNSVSSYYGSVIVVTTSGHIFKQNFVTFWNGVGTTVTAAGNNGLTWNVKVRDLNVAFDAYGDIKYVLDSSLTQVPGPWTFIFSTKCNQLDELDLSTLQPTPFNTTKTSSSASSTNTVTTGGTAQVLVSANTNRLGLEFQNNSVGDMRIAFGNVASASNGFVVKPDGIYTTLYGAVYVGAVSLFGATTGQQFTVVEYT